MNHLVAPSVLASDFANLERDIKMLNNSQADYIHCDIMDGVFVPNISFGFPVLSHIKKHAEKPLDVHLMIVDPDKYISEFRKAGADILTVHLEACPHLHRTIQSIKDNGMKASVCLNPATPVENLSDIIEELDMVLLMSVNPGFGGQTFIDNTYNKIKKLKSMILEKKSSAKIEVDGGVSFDNARELVGAGVDVLVAGSFVFKSENPEETIRGLRKLDF